MKLLFTLVFVCSTLYSFAVKDTLAIQDFETSPKTPTWNFTGPVVYNSGYSTASAAPPNSPIGINGSRAWETTTNSGGLVLEFDNVSIPSGYDTVRVEFRLAAMNLGGSSGGPDNLDYVLVQVSTDGGASYYTRIRIRGASTDNSFWEYAATGVAEAYYQPQTEVMFQPTSSGLQTTNGYSKVIVKFPGNVGQVRLKLTGRSSSASDTWLIDNVLITGENNCVPKNTTRNVAICNGKSFFAGGKPRTTAGTYYDTLTTSDGCDSVVITKLTLNPTYNIPQTVTICNGDSILLGTNYRKTAGTYYDSLMTAKSCDSIITYTLGVNPTYTTPRTVTICQGESAFLAGANQTAQGIYYDTLSTAKGCDSVIATTLVVNMVYNMPRTISICDGDSIMASGQYQKTGGVYYDTLTSAKGCDSIIATTLVIKPVHTMFVLMATCDGDSLLINGKYRSQAGLYVDSLKSSQGCDSVVLVNLTVNPTYVINTNAAICYNDSLLINGKYVNTPGTYIDSFITVAGCDSLIQITLSVNSVNIAVTQNANVLTATAAGASYQWLDCNNAFKIITAQTSQNFTATANGSYAVAITQNNCTDTSTCYAVTGVGIADIDFAKTVTVYPNPAKSTVIVSLDRDYPFAEIGILSITGQVLHREIILNSNTARLDVSQIATGVYFVEIKADGKRAMVKLVVE